MAISAKYVKAPFNPIRTLRISKLRSGNPFLIYSPTLPARHAYLEFPDGRIVLVTVKRGDRDFTTVSELSAEENKAVRSEFNLEPII
jgi:hypothetical protein